MTLLAIIVLFAYAALMGLMEFVGEIIDASTRNEGRSAKEQQDELITEELAHATEYARWQRQRNLERQAREEELARQREQEERMRATQDAIARANLVTELEDALKIKVDKNKAGYVYILQFNNNIYKIGHTQRHPQTRASEWGLRLCAYAKADDSGAAERALHGYLSPYRQGKKYELFEVDFKVALRALSQVVGQPEIVSQPT